MLQTRSRPASAIVLAQKWAGFGYGHIEIIDQSGQACAPEQFRKRHMRPEMRRVFHGVLAVILAWHAILTIRAESLPPWAAQPGPWVCGHAAPGDGGAFVRYVDDFACRGARSRAIDAEVLRLQARRAALACLANPHLSA